MIEEKNYSLVIEMSTKLPLIHRIVSLLLALLFGWSAAMQTNDPDPGLWIIVYLVLALTCVLAALWRVMLPLVGIAGITAFAWSASLFPGVMELFTNHSVGDLLTGMSPDRPYVEAARESLGLLIGALGMAYLAWQVAQTKRRGTHTTA